MEKRVRFCLEVIDNLISVLGSTRVGIKVSPSINFKTKIVSRFNDMYDEDPIKLFSLLFKELSTRKIAFVEMANNNDPET